MSTTQSATTSNDVNKTSPNVTSITEQFSSLLNTLSSFKSQISMLSSQVKALEKNVKKQMKQYQREIKKQSKQIKKKPSGFAVPTKVSEKLSKFMGLTEGQQVARTEVTKYIINYIKTNNLQNPNNNQCIIPDTKLNTLFDNNNEEITYFNIQKHMNKHFIK